MADPIAVVLSRDRATGSQQQELEKQLLAVLAERSELVVTATAGEVDVDQLRDDLHLLAALRTPFSVKELVASIQAAFGD